MSQAPRIFLKKVTPGYHCLHLESNLFFHKYIRNTDWSHFMGRLVGLKLLYLGLLWGHHVVGYICFLG